ncbi:MAG: NUDIX domain-containing protein [Chloroflexi bacterium]|nr:NUDIX domain-containing protein [Chloroflexota bacterium]
MAKKKKKKRRIRPLALCVFFRDDKIFLAQGYDSHERRTFYRPIGGRIEFGERGCQAVVRELREEIDAEVTDLEYLGALENIFEYEGVAGHEIALIYKGRFAEERFADDDFTVRGLNKGKVLYEAAWMPLDLFRGETATALYPAGLLELLEGTARR